MQQSARLSDGATARYNRDVTPRAPAAPLYAAVEAALSAQGKTKTWLHETSGIARTTIDRWKTQKNPPLAATVVPVAKTLGIDEAEALRLGGVGTDVTVTQEAGPVSLADLDTDVLLAEIRRRITG